ncbi:MAG: homocysteine S-methyltransferase family protein [Acutalibacteraceae bacterium]|nr:homocysteine S-methyltransferase family protein [Acutalibacteraceae bacterium]
MVFNKLLKENKFIILDGAMGTQLQAKGLKTGECPELLSITHPEIVEDIHRAYINAGSMIVYTNTFGANSYKLAESGYTVQEVVSASVKVAKNATKGTSALVALDIGPIGKLMEPTGSMSFDEAYNTFKEVVEAGKDADLIVFETMTDLLELKAGVLAVKENSNKPVICTMTFEENMRTFTGCCVSSMAITLEGLGVNALGVNCSLGPVQLQGVVNELAKWTTLPVIVKPNAGLPDPATGKYNLSPVDFATSIAESIVPTGALILGGCCGTTPEYIKELTTALSKIEPVKRSNKAVSAVCSATKTVVIDQPRIIGERINPTGKKLFKEALRNNDLDYILTQGIEQVNAGADILDVNVGLPEIDEEKMMVRAVKGLQGVVDVPLQLDSTIPQVLESALRVYSGKPIVNSVNGEEKSLEAVLPLVKKYGASVVGLTLDKNGIPKTAEGRFEIAKRIVERANALGIENKDIYIDCLTLTASAEQEGVIETLNALERVKKELGVKTVLGVSNISFGLPNRELVTSTFLTMALQKGLDLPIINPNVDAMTGAVRAYKLLANIDKNSVDFIKAYNNAPAKKQATTAKAEVSLSYAIENGLKKEGALVTEKLLEAFTPMEIINQQLIPTLDKAGADFETGKIFLPQLIQSATAAQACFEVIKKKLINENSAPVSKGKIVLATVKGDVHDIGKNIVKVLLENYGYTVIDLGKDVEYEEVVKATIENDVKLVGLSALMTTTLKAMEETIALLRKSCDCKVMVGGAVLTPEYAEKIGADYYSRDAKESVDIAKRVLG